MKLYSIDITRAINQVQNLLKEEKGLSPALKSSLELLLVIVTLLVNRLGVNSKNSSKPPSSDPNREKVKKASAQKRPGGQKGRTGVTLEKVDNPDFIEPLKIDRRTIPKGKYRDVGYESRQVVDIDIRKIVTEYRAQILEDEAGNQYTASFPKDVTAPIQYGNGVKANSVYMSQYQLIPYNRVEETLKDQMSIPLSAGSIYNFNEDAYQRLEKFEKIVKNRLINSELLHSDETGINIDGKRVWLHSVCTSKLSYFLAS